MPTQVDDLYAEKQSIIDELFIKTADDNYVTARWCFHQNLNVDYLWLAVHCVEKYLKAVLLFNGGTSKRYGHAISELYADVRKLADDLLPVSPVKPPWTPEAMWRSETFEEFIGRLYRDGQEHNRYQLYGYSKMPADLWKLDQLVFNIRRICCPLDVNVMGEDLPGGPRLSNREKLKAAPKRWALHSRLEDALNGKLGEEVKKAAETWNFPFTPENYAHPEMSYSFATKDSVFIRRLFDPLEAGAAEFPKSDRLWSWVRDNIKLPCDFIQEIEEERERLKSVPHG